MINPARIEQAKQDIAYIRASLEGGEQRYANDISLTLKIAWMLAYMLIEFGRDESNQEPTNFQHLVFGAVALFTFIALLLERRNLVRLQLEEFSDHKVAVALTSSKTFRQLERAIQSQINWMDSHPNAYQWFGPYQRPAAMVTCLGTAYLLRGPLAAVAEGTVLTATLIHENERDQEIPPKPPLKPN